MRSKCPMAIGYLPYGITYGKYVGPGRGSGPAYMYLSTSDRLNMILKYILTN
jgi:hypothetical protein